MTILSWTESYGERMFRNFDMSLLKRDDAYLNIFTDKITYLYSVYKECHKCPFTQELRGNPMENNTTLIINNQYAKLWRILLANSSASSQNSTTDVFCTLDADFGQFGVYKLNITDEECILSTLKEPVNIYFPILTVCLIYLTILSFLYGVLYFCTKAVNQSSNVDEKHVQNRRQENGKKHRIESLDTFRGFCIITMIFIIYGNGGYAIVGHTVWNGCQFGDFMFPWFLWIMGVCTPISISSSLKKDIPKTTMLVNVIKRSVKLFCLGLFLEGNPPDLDTVRIFGVFQRFGICYLVVASMCIIFTKKEYSAPTAPFQNVFKDIIAIKYQWISAIVLVTAHCLLTFALPVPNCPTGYLGPGGLHENGEYYNCAAGATGYIDKLLLGNHIFKYPSSQQIYNTPEHDPEGILGSITAVIQVILGVQAGSTLLFYKEHSELLKRWLLWSLVLGIVGGCLCGFAKEDGLIPLNKNLWSLSYVFVTASSAFILFAICYYIVDVKNWWSGKPFSFVGLNAIIIYVGQNLTYLHFPFQWISQSEITTHFITLTGTFWTMTLWMLIAYYLYKKNIIYTI